VNGATREWAEKCLLPQCLTWLREAKVWPDSAALDEFVLRELVAALQQLPALELSLPEATPRLPVWSSAVAAGGGALLGMLLLTPLALLLVGQRDIGLCVGGILGSAALVTLVGLLAGAPQIRAAVSSVLLVSGTGSLVGGVWAYWRNQSTGWLRGSLGVLGTGFVVFLARPRLVWPARAEYLQRVRGQLVTHLGHVADLVLAWCWSHPGRLPAGPQGEKEPAAHLSGQVWASLADLRTQLACADGAVDDLHDSVEELLQRFEDDGYEWKAIPAHTPFAEAMKEDFETVGLIGPGQPVRMRRAALRYRGQLLRKGELRRA
jgi:hypothetical protein